MSAALLERSFVRRAHILSAVSAVVVSAAVCVQAAAATAPLSPEQLRVAQAATEAATDRMISLNGPSGIAERMRSRLAYSGSLGPDAYDIAKQTFGSLVSGPLWQPPELRKGEEAVGMLGDRVMQIERDGAPAGLIQSAVPLQAPTANGSRSPTDLTLTDAGRYYVPKTPLVRVRLPKTLSTGFTLPDIGLELVPATPTAVTGTVRDSRVFFPDVATDTDLITGTVPGGLSLLYQLRSERSPRTVRLRVAMPEGSTMRTSGSEVHILDRVGDVMATVRAPQAIDSQGQAHDVAYSIAGTELTVAVAPGPDNIAYPLLIDPVVDQQQWYYGAGVSQWFYTTARSDGFFPSTGGSWGSGLYSVLGGSRYYTMGESGEWRYPLYGTSFAYRTIFGPEQQITNSPYQAVCTTVGFRQSDGWGASSTWYDWRWREISGTGARTRCHSYQHNGSDICLQADCGVPAAASTNVPFFQQWTYGNSVRDGMNVAYIGNGTVYITDPENPSVNGAPPASGERSTSFTVGYADPGLGLKRIRLWSPGNPDWDQAHDQTYSCAALNSSRCPPGAFLGKTFGNLPAGPQVIEAQAFDAGGRESPIQRWTVFVEGDAVGPESISPDDPLDPEEGPDESGPADRALSAADRDAALAAMSQDPQVQAVLSGRPYTIELGPWTERSASTGEEYSVGATAQIVFASSQSWATRSWPVMSYDGEPTEATTYAKSSIRAAADDIDLLSLDVDLRSSEVVNMFPQTQSREDIASEPTPTASRPTDASPPTVTAAPEEPVVFSGRGDY